MTAPIVVSPESDADAAVWALTREVASLFASLPWILIGGQMVAIHEAEHGLRPLRSTVDVDALVDVRTMSTVTLAAARLLQSASFDVQHDADGLAYRFVRGLDIVDVLAPDHLGSHADLRTVPPETTLEALGGRQALNRQRTILVDAGDGAFTVPIPMLAGAIIIKARVTGAARQPEKHRRDLARLLALVDDPGSIRRELTGTERSYLRSRSELLDRLHPAWRGIRRADDAITALAMLGE
jgi:hypothetical protein